MTTLNHLIGQPKSAIFAKFTDGVEFLHWLYLPTIGVLLSFDKQICCQITRL